MPSTTTQTTIVNRALQLLGYKAVGSIQDNDRGARAMNRAYTPVLLSMLRDNFWGFAITRANLAASSVPPIFGPANAYPLPGDFVCLAPPDPSFSVNAGGPVTGNTYQTDWRIEGGQILSDMAPPLQIRYVTSNVSEAQFDPSFAEALSALLAMETCEELTQSNTKIETAEKMYDDAMEMAKQRNAFEARPIKAPASLWLTKRL